MTSHLIMAVSRTSMRKCFDSAFHLEEGRKEAAPGQDTTVVFSPLSQGTPPGRPRYRGADREDSSHRLAPREPSDAHSIYGEAFSYHFRRSDRQVGQFLFHVPESLA